MLPLPSAMSGNSWAIDLLISLLGVVGMGALTYTMRWLPGKALDDRTQLSEKREAISDAVIAAGTKAVALRAAPAPAECEDALLSVD